MGYSTDFQGRFDLDRELDNETHELLEGLATTRRMKRKVDGKYGVEGEFYIYGSGQLGQNPDDATILDYNRPPATQPGLWCQWTPTADKKGLQWDGGEKFYSYVEWLKYLIDSVLAPRNYVLNGQVYWQGEDSDDRGRIDVKDNKIAIMHATVTYQERKYV